ncbi:MAG: LCP family protein [Naasia sp.]
MTRRAWFLVVLNVLIPGSAQVLAGNRRLGRLGLGATLALWTLVVLLGVLYFVSQSVLFDVVANPIALTIAQILLAGYAVLWIVLAVDTLRLVRFVRLRSRARPLVALFSIAALVLMTGTAAYGAVIAGATRDTITNVFSASPPEPPIDGRYNIMLLGGDAGPDREGMRPDSVSVVSIEDATGKVSMFGLPRDLDQIPFSAESPMLASYPDGYGYDGVCDVDVCQLNSIYTEVTLKSPELYPDAEARGSEPGIEAMRDAVEGALGIQIQYYVLIDMQGFEQLINALGGITVDVTERIPIGGSEDLSDVGAWIEPGTQHLDGNWALWYARSRHGSATGDYARMERQRQVQEAMLQQLDPANVLLRFQDVAAAGADVVKTDIPQGTLGRFVQLAMLAKEQPITDIDFVPPLIDPSEPDWALVHQTVAEAMALTPAE